MKQNILATDFNAKSLFNYIIPTIFMMVFMSTYTIIDGIFVAKLVGEDALSAINIVFPILLIILSVSLMFATGGNAVISRFLGEGREKDARSFLSAIYILGFVISIILTVIFIIFSDEIVTLLGASDLLFPYAKSYLLSLAPFVLGYFFQVYVQSFLITAGKPVLGFLMCVSGGITNIILDYFLISPDFLNLGIAGAGIATGIGNLIPGIGGLLYFAIKKNPHLYFTKPLFNAKLIFSSIYNGLSELVTQISTAITTIIFNIILLDLAGEAGVASISVILYLQMMQTAIYMGISIGIAPIIGYKYGENNREGLKKVINLGLKFVLFASLIVIICSVVFSDFLVGIFIERTSSTFAMAKEGLIIFSISYLFMGFNMYISSMFTSLSNGKASAFLSILRTFVFLVPMLLSLPLVLNLLGVWLAVPFSELLCILVSIYFYKKYTSKYF